MDKKQVDKFIEMAKKASRHGKHDRYLVGAVLVKNGNVLSIGSNSNKTHPFMGRRTTHAEIACMIGRRWQDFKHATMFVARTSKVNCRVGMARPCPTCRHVLRDFGIKSIYFTSENGVVEHLKL